MDPDRWPEKVRAFVAELVCPRCGERRNGRKGIFCQVRYMAEALTWNIQAECWSCSQSWFWNLSPTTTEGIEDLTPQPAIQIAQSMSVSVIAVEDAGADPTPLPSWLKQLNDLPPGSTT